MMQKEEKVVVVLLVVAVLSLIIGYFGFAIPAQIKAYSSDSKLGERVYVEGTVLSKKMTKTGDNLVIKLSNLNINVFVRKDNGAKDVYSAVKAGDSVRITGKVQEYNNEREIVVESAKDVVRY